MRVASRTIPFALIAILSFATACSSSDGPCYPSTIEFTFEGELKTRTTQQYSSNGLLRVREEYSGSSELMRRDTFKYDLRSNLVLSEFSDGDGNISGRETSEYDQRGNLVLRESSDENGRISWDISEYDNDNNQISSKQFSTSDGLRSGWVARYEGQNLIQKDRLDEDGSIENRLTFEYDEDNRLKTRTTGPADESPHAKSSYFYRGALLIRREAEVYLEGLPDTLETFKYDTQDRLVERCFTNPFDQTGLTISCHYFRYDDEAMSLTKEYDNDGDGKVESFLVHTFDGELLMSVSSIYADGEIEYIESYRYDSRGNLIREEFDPLLQGESHSVTKTSYRCF